MRRLRNSLAVSAATVAALAMTASAALAAPSVHGTGFLFGWLSQNSPAGGYGSAEAYTLTATTGYIEACDLGVPDGLDAVAILEWGPNRWEARDGGNGSACATQNITLPAEGSNVEVTIWACLKNGPSGVLQYCDSNYIVR
ncbi:hypothetical protein [Streptomyces sp. NPDC004726]